MTEPERVFVDTARQVCELAKVDPANVASIHWYPTHLEVQVFETNPDGTHMLDDSGELIYDILRFPGAQVQ